MTNPLLPTSPGDFPAEVRERLDRLESASRMSNVGAYAGDMFLTVTPPVSGTFGDPTGGGLAGPNTLVSVPPSHSLLVIMSMKLNVNITADATPITVSVEATVTSTSGSVIAASSLNGVIWKATTIANQPLVTELTLARTVSFRDLDAIPTRLKLVYRSATTNGAKTVITVENRTIAAVPL